MGRKPDGICLTLRHLGDQSITAETITLRTCRMKRWGIRGWANDKYSLDYIEREEANEGTEDRQGSRIDARDALDFRQE